MDPCDASSRTNTEGSSCQHDDASSQANTEGSPCQHDENSVDGHIINGYSGTRLSEEIWHRIHSLMPMQDAAQIACVARTFVRSWRCHPNLHFSEETLGLATKNLCGNEQMARDITSSRVDHILRNHSGIGVKTLTFEVDPFYKRQVFPHHDLDRWLQNTVKPGIEELNLCLDRRDTLYNFPWSLLSEEIGDSLQYLKLVYCNFHPTSMLSCLRNLTRLELRRVSITDNELECLLSKSFALKRFVLFDCSGIVHLKIPCLQKLNYLEVVACIELQEIEIRAPNVNFFSFDLRLRLLLPESSRIKKVNISCVGAAFYARTTLPSNMPILETLNICSGVERFNTPLMPSRFLHLKVLHVTICGSNYDFCSLLSFLVASPSLEDFILTTPHIGVTHVSVFEDPSDLREMPENHYDKLKRVQIINFSSARSLVELTIHIVESASFLESLTLDTTHGFYRCFVNKCRRCIPLSRIALGEAHRGVLVAQRYIKPKVPSMVEFNVVEPCSRCHVV